MLNELSLKPIYSTDSDNLANDFYIPLLSEAVCYKRVSGYFSSGALSLFASGIERLEHNGGKYSLLISNEISELDYRKIKEGYLNRESSKKLIYDGLSDYEYLSRNQRKDFANLSYLIEIGLVDIKIGFTREGLFHSKYGIISDSEGNKVYFSGSLNETKAAFLKNYESITVINSWNGKNESDTIGIEEQKFDKLWSEENPNNMIFVKEFNEILKSSLIKYSKGKIIMDSKLMSDNALVLYYENNQLYIQDNLQNQDVLDSNRQIKKIKNQYLIHEKLWEFRDDLIYTDLLEIVALLNKYGKKTETNIVISESVNNFIESQRFMISEVAKRGLMIKNQDSMMLDAFNQFCGIVSQEVYRNLRDIQAWVSFYMATMQRVGNFSVPGAGKTAMVYGAYAYLSSPKINQVDKIVVIGPKSSFKSWKDEFSLVFGAKRTLHELDIHSEYFHPQMLSKNVENYNLLLFNYESLPKYEKELNKIITDRTMLVFDEVHKIKGKDSKRAPIAINLTQNAKYRYVLTGTPIPNGYIDVWNFLHILYNNEYKSYFGMSSFELNNIDAVSVDDFNDKLFPFYWRVNKSELNVPAANSDNFYSATATDSEQNIIDLLWRKYRHNPLVLYTRLIQFSSNPELLKKNIDKSLFVDIVNDDEENQFKKDSLTFEYIELMNDEPTYSREELQLIDDLSVSSKFKKAISKADSLVQDNKTVIIWCIFVDTMKKVVRTLEDEGHTVALIYGEIPAFKREEIITDFQHGKYDVLVTNPHTLAESVSLHKACHDAIYLEYSFNLTHMLQSRDRIHRLGLDVNEETNYYYFFLTGQKERRDTIDQKIYKRLKEKEELMIEAVEGTQIGVNFSLDEKSEILDMMSEYI